MKLLVPALTALLALTGSALAAAPASTASTASDRTQWFREARFGLFIHWGVYAVPAGEWQGKPVNGIGEWIMKNGKIPVADYRAFAKDFTAANYDPAAWAALARRAGMKYVVITSKHHDGFALYDSAASDWNAVKASGAARDLLAPLAAAVRTEGLKFGLYYSQAQDWTNPGGAKAGNTPDWDPAQTGDYDAYLQTVALPQVREIIERYDPAIIWWDTPTGMSRERVKPFADLMTKHSEILNNDRLGVGFHGDTSTPEQYIPPRGYPGKMFEVCMTMNNTWGFKKNDTAWKSVRQLLRNLSDISSKGGNFLLNVGPTAEGEIPAASIERLEAVGRWMDVNAESIHATEAGPFPRRLPWGRVTQKRAADGATTLYLHVWEWPADGRVLLPTVAQAPRAARLLAGSAAVSTKPSPEGLVVLLPTSAPDPDVSVVRLDFPAAVTVTQEPFLTPGPDGRVTFGAADADAHGHWDGNIQLRDSGPDAYLADWKNPKWKLEYALKTRAAGKWTVSAEVAAPVATPLVLAVGKTETPAAVEATGPGLAWKTVTLGVIELPAGETAFELRGAPKGWKGLSLRHVWLTPAP
ncbi:MAG: alpha-L-fucosidase [Burkholderiales bacterium]|nr:alpha-L-fucosidase [Opitutaceae bacterium]